VPGLDCSSGPAEAIMWRAGMDDSRGSGSNLCIVCSEVSLSKAKQGVGMWQGSSHEEDMELCNCTVRSNRGCIGEIATILTDNIIKIYFYDLVSVGKPRRFSSLEIKTWLCLQSGTEPTLQSPENSHLVL
jgi:hypothetical protein